MGKGLLVDTQDQSKSQNQKAFAAIKKLYDKSPVKPGQATAYSIERAVFEGLPGWKKGPDGGRTSLSIPIHQARKLIREMSAEYDTEPPGIQYVPTSSGASGTITTGIFGLRTHRAQATRAMVEAQSTVIRDLSSA